MFDLVLGLLPYIDLVYLLRLDVDVVRNSNRFRVSIYTLRLILLHACGPLQYRSRICGCKSDCAKRGRRIQEDMYEYILGSLCEMTTNCLIFFI